MSEAEMHEKANKLIADIERERSPPPDAGMEERLAEAWEEGREASKRFVCPDNPYRREVHAAELKLDSLHINLLMRGSGGREIGLSDDMMFRMGEIVALGELSRAGYVELSKRPHPPGPPSPTLHVPTEAGERALKVALGPGRPVPHHGSGP